MKHVVVDFSYLYYKYKFMIMSGRGKVLTAEINGEQKDVSLIYYILKEIHTFRNNNSDKESGITARVTVCFDMPSKRKEMETDGAAEYKANRVSKLDNSDFDVINEIYYILEQEGTPVLKREGIEADDWIYNIVKVCKNKYDETVIYTPDTDMLYHVCENVNVMLYRTSKGSILVSLQNWEEVCENMFKVKIPYNALALYKVLCGDKSDNIDGVRGFGNKAFEKLIKKIELNSKNPRDIFFTMSDYSSTEKLLLYMNKSGFMEGIFKGIWFEQAINALQLVRGIDIIDESVENLEDNYSREKQKEVYSRYGIKSI